MRMRLSEKGQEKLAYLVDLDAPIEDLEFWPDDFVGCVVLTVEEAKDFLGWLHNSQWKHRTDLEYAEDWQRDWIRYLKERIEQVEGK